jgi:hypothetical protein
VPRSGAGTERRLGIFRVGLRLPGSSSGCWLIFFRFDLPQSDHLISNGLIRALVEVDNGRYAGTERSTCRDRRHAFKQRFATGGYRKQAEGGAYAQRSPPALVATHFRGSGRSPVAFDFLHDVAGPAIWSALLGSAHVYLGAQTSLCFARFLSISGAKQPAFPPRWLFRAQSSLPYAPLRLSADALVPGPCCRHLAQPIRRRLRAGNRRSWAWSFCCPISHVSQAGAGALQSAA